mmetsp:Transcript_10080/g.28698  ORF Transcript_10080/g.28698 Transcript_10080/m.28698 type:complete len:298 (+) Transcript_10080:828-1721(+)
MAKLTSLVIYDTNITAEDPINPCHAATSAASGRSEEEARTPHEEPVASTRSCRDHDQQRGGKRNEIAHRVLLLLLLLLVRRKRSSCNASLPSPKRLPSSVKQRPTATNLIIKAAAAAAAGGERGGCRTPPSRCLVIMHMTTPLLSQTEQQQPTTSTMRTPQPDPWEAIWLAIATRSRSSSSNQRCSRSPIATSYVSASSFRKNINNEAATATTTKQQHQQHHHQGRRLVVIGVASTMLKLPRILRTTLVSKSQTARNAAVTPQAAVLPLCTRHAPSRVTCLALQTQTRSKPTHQERN